MFGKYAHILQVIIFNLFQANNQSKNMACATGADVSNTSEQSRTYFFSVSLNPSCVVLEIMASLPSLLVMTFLYRLTLILPYKKTYTFTSIGVFADPGDCF